MQQSLTTTVRMQTLGLLPIDIGKFELPQDKLCHAKRNLESRQLNSPG
jgi:hypothetical protein